MGYHNSSDVILSSDVPELIDRLVLQFSDLILSLVHRKKDILDCSQWL